MTVEGTVVGIEPSSEYQGTVYDQLVVVDLAGGPRFGVFDMDMLVDESAVGTRMELSLGLLTGQSNIEQVAETEPRIEPAENHLSTWQNHVYYGSIDHLTPGGEYEYDASLDIGIGTVSISPRKDAFPTLSEGTYLKAHASRTDLWGIEEIDP